MHINYWAVFAAAFIPLIWVFMVSSESFRKNMDAGSRINRCSDERCYGRSLCFYGNSFLFDGIFLQYITIHQFGAVGMIGGDEMNANRLIMLS